MSEEKGKRWFESSPGNTSAMRVALMLSITLGVLLGLTAIVMGFIVLFTQAWEGASMVSVFITGAAGCIAVGDIAKSIQSAGKGG